MNEKRVLSFTGRMSRGEAAAALAYLPLHVFLLPMGLSVLMLFASLPLSNAGFNLLYYGVGTAYMLLFLRKFLRREFDPLCDRPLNCFVEILICYGIMLALNMLVSGLLSLVATDNPNNAAIMDMADRDTGKVAAMAVFLAPLVEEPMFRGSVFGLIRRKSRLLAYAVSMLLFSLYHVWAYALSDPGSWIYIVQYLPASYVLCRCYERTDSLWGSIFLHMMINGISLAALSLLEGML